MKHILITRLLAIVLLMVGAGAAQVPKTLSYQGVLTNAGAPVPDGSYSLTFSIYAEPSGGLPLWTETQSADVHSGVFNAILGKTTPLNLSFDQAYWLGIAVA